MSKQQKPEVGLVRPIPSPKPYPGVDAWQISYTDESAAKTKNKEETKGSHYNSL